MKKILCFLLFALCVTTAANAQFLAFDFENGNILTTVFTNDETYPWIVIDTTDDDGNAVRCIMSGNRGVASSTSAIETTLGLAADGYIAFDALCMGEGTNTAWDKCIFYIDGEAQFTYGAHIAGWNHYAYNVSAGSHTFKWEYQKDNSVNNRGDAFFVDNIVFSNGELCEAPVSLKAEQYGLQSVEVSWQSHSSSFNLRYRLVGTTLWTNVSGSISANTCMISNLEAGSYEVQVAATCDADNWTSAIFNIQEISSTATWYGYALYITNDEGSETSDENHFISFSMQNPETIDQATLSTVTETYAACYANNYVWCITKNSGNLCRATVNNTDHSIGTFETVVAGFETNNAISMSYNPIDGKIYYIVGGGTFFSFDPENPANTVSDGITLTITAETFAINQNGEAYCIEYESGNLYRIDLSDGSTTLVGNTGQNVNYVQSMAFDMNTGELFWAQISSATDNGLYIVNPATAETFLLGHIGGGTTAEITGLFMVWDDEVVFEDCTVPYQLNVSEVAATTASVSWTEKGEATSWVVAYKAYGETDFTETTVNETSYTLSSLTPETSYFVKVRPVCEDGSLKWRSVTFTTHGLCDDPSNVVVTPGSTTATLTWTGYQEEYNVRYRSIDTILFVDFEDGLPSGWTTIDNDADGYDWYEYTYNEASFHSGTMVMTSASYINNYGPLYPDNWLITPQIELGNTLRVWLNGQDPNGYDKEHFAIYLSTTGNSVSDFTTTLVGETETTHEWTEYTADLSAYAGQQGYIAIRHFNCTDQFQLNVDDFGVYNEDPWTTTTATDNTVVLTGLEPETTYEVQVQGICESGVTAWTEPEEFTTEAEPTCVINTIEITGFTEPVYGEHPDYDVEVPADADYTLDNVLWAEYNSEMTAETFVANWYFMVFDIAPNEGCIFADNLTVTINGDASLFNYGVVKPDGDYRVFSKDYYLSVPPCETPTNVTVSDITANSATVSWTGSLEEYNVLYGTNLINYRSDFETDESVDGWMIFDADGDGYNWEWWTTYRNESHSGTSLLISRSYYSGALDPDNWLITPTIDLGGTMSVWVRSWYSSYLENFAIYLTTNPDYEGVEDFNIELVGQTTAPYEWTEYTVDLSAYVGQRGAIAIRHFNSEDNYILLVDDFSVIDGTAMTATGNSIELTNLDPETAYEVQVQGICEYSVLSAWTEPEEFITEAEPAPTCEAPTGLTATNITATTAKLEWTGSQDQYTVRYKEDAASDWTEATTTNRFFPLTGLTPETTYTAQVQGDCGTGAKVVTDWSEPVTFTTLSGTIEPGECGPAVDCEGTSYPTVKIGDVCWMAKNLAAETCVTTGNVYSYVNDQFPDEDANVETYGLLYDEEAAFATGICPEGYTLPTTEQFEYLKNNFTVEELRNITGWVVNTGTNGTGFSWDGSGFRNGTSETFEHMLLEGYLWAVDMTSGTPQPAMYKMMYYCNEIVRVYDFNGISASIRCVKDAEPQPEPEPETFRCGTSPMIDAEYNEYKTVEIGTQCWTKTNMRAHVGTEVTYDQGEKPADEPFYFVVSGRDVNIYGYLYNWKAAKMVCPDGWHLPTDAEWTQMENELSNIEIDPDATGIRGDHLEKLAAEDPYWAVNTEHPNSPGYTTPSEDRNISEFSARPMGHYYQAFQISSQTYYAHFWTATEVPGNSDNAFDRWMCSYETGVARYGNHKKTMGYSVRCVRNAEE